ncbi:MAG: ATP-binding protein [Ruminococcaceae bacterium]|nr:ATP-binding protein [Oscillospiraceae bacterium]
MKELSLHIADIIQNSIVAGASVVKVAIIEDIKKNILKISVEDNGKGMSKELLLSAADPFTTSRKTRRVGLGIPLFKQSAHRAGGDLSIKSSPGAGTMVMATFVHDHIDRQPLGDIAGTMLCAIVSNSDTDFVYTHSVNSKSFVIDTKDLKNTLGIKSFSEPDVYIWIKNYFEERENEILN